jgi:hypothetical protein
MGLNRYICVHKWAPRPSKYKRDGMKTIRAVYCTDGLLSLLPLFIEEAGYWLAWPVQVWSATPAVYRICWNRRSGSPY